MVYNNIVLGTAVNNEAKQCTTLPYGLQQLKILQKRIKIQCGLQQFIIKQSSVQTVKFTSQNTDAKQYTIIPLRLKQYISIQGIVQEYNTV